MAANLTILKLHKTSKIYRKARPPFGELGVHFGKILRVLEGLGGVLGCLGGWSGQILAPKCVLGGVQGDFTGLDGSNLGPKMASNWGPDRTNIDANIGRIFDAFANRNLDGQN